MPRTLCLSGAGCGARCALCEFLDRGANMVGTQVGVSLHHDRCLPAAGPLDRVEVDPGGYSVEKACLLLGAQATIAGVVLSCELDQEHPWAVSVLLHELRLQ